MKPVYCPSHLGIHTSSWCTAGSHIEIEASSAEEAAAEARRRGFIFFYDDVDPTRDSAVDPRPGDVVGDKRAWIPGCGFHLSYLREVVRVEDGFVEWKRPGEREGVIRCSRSTWRRWASGSWRCNPETGKPTRKSWRPTAGWR